MFGPASGGAGRLVGVVLEAIPESRVIVLVRDPRDVMASVADALRVPDSWARRQFATDLAFDLEAWAQGYAAAMAATLVAHDAHSGPKVIVTYEELRADTHAALGRVSDTLGLVATGEQIAAAVRKHAWENIPADEKGSGRFYRKASPGAWRDDLTEAEIAIVERHAAPVLERFYSPTSGTR